MLRRFALACAAALLAAPTAARALRPVRSMLELRQQGVVRQGFDLSCGAAALATVLTYEYGDRVDEKEVVETLLRSSGADRIRERGGFSLLDLKRFAVARGYVATGYKGLDLAALERLGTAIVPTTTPAGPHFVVVRGVVEGRVVIADPAYGNLTLPASRFDAMWSPRVAFVVRRPGAPERGGPAPALVPPVVVRRAIGAGP
jgi:predicted double-glycine peptidase